LSERKNQWVEQFLRMVTSAQQDDWADWLPVATAVHNNWENATVKVSPVEVIMGSKPKLDGGPDVPTNNQTVEERAHQIKERRAQAITVLNKAAQTMIKDQYQVGDQVWLEAKNLALPYPTTKLAPRRHGPFTITRRVSAVVYQLKLPPAWTIHDVFHASILTPYVETRAHGPNYERPPPELERGKAEYEVEAVVGHCLFGRGRKLQYLIKWKGYPTSDNTWEPSEGVFAPDLIASYHQRNPLEGPPRVKRRRVQVRTTTTPLPLHPSLIALTKPPTVAYPSPLRSGITTTPISNLSTEPVDSPQLAPTARTALATALPSPL